jgi:hypothetical protein
MSSNVDRLGDGQVRDLADWFLTHMPMDMRHRLMAEMPVTYGAMFPGVAPDVITERVGQRIASDRADAELGELARQQRFLCLDPECGTCPAGRGHNGRSHTWAESSRGS